MAEPLHRFLLAIGFGHLAELLGRLLVRGADQEIWSANLGAGPGGGSEDETQAHRQSIERPPKVHPEDSEGWSGRKVGGARRICDKPNRKP
jgi:hypothetical protein